MNKLNRTKQSAKLVIYFLYTLVCCVSFYIMWMCYYREIVFFYRKGNWVVHFLYFVFFIIFGKLFDAFKFGILKLSDVILSSVLTILFSDSLIYLVSCLIKYRFIDFSGIAMLFLIQTFISIVFYILVNSKYYSIFKGKRTLMLFEGDDNAQLDEVYGKILKYQKNNFEIEKKMDVKSCDDYSLLKEYEAIIMINLSVDTKKQISELCYKNTIELYNVPNIYELLINGATVVNYIDTPIIKMNNFGPTQFQKIIKRLFDFVASLIAIIVTSPIWLIVALAIKIDDHGPIFYKQERLTLHGAKFNILKFRSMKMDAEKDGVKMAGVNDNRITRVGKFIRACRIDELPQLLNILKGEMSIVGPRPERPEIVYKVTEKMPEFDYRLKVKAGLTGYAQVYGKYNTKLSDKLLLDILYIENYSLLLDIKIMLLTIRIIFSKESTEGVD